MIWKFTGDRPVYLQIMEQLQGAILSGEFTAGQKIPSVRDLAMEAQVNPNTMQHALQELERLQLLITDGTNGRHVTMDTRILDNLRDQRLIELVEECVTKFQLLGISPSQAADLLMQASTERNA